jgi:hypothetical protein
VNVYIDRAAGVVRREDDHSVVLDLPATSGGVDLTGYVQRWARTRGHDVVWHTRIERVAGASIEVDGRTYAATLTGDTVRIAVDGVWAGTGLWDGSIYDCPANLPGRVWDQLEAALRTSLGEGA